MRNTQWVYMEPKLMVYNENCSKPRRRINYRDTSPRLYPSFFSTLKITSQLASTLDCIVLWSVVANLGVKMF